jgi:hypothetical protein
MQPSKLSFQFWALVKTASQHRFISNAQVRTYRYQRNHFNSEQLQLAKDELTKLIVVKMDIKHLKQNILFKLKYRSVHSNYTITA